MSRTGAMVDYVKTKILDISPEATVTDIEQTLDAIDDKDLPFCVITSVIPVRTLIAFRQREETTTMLVEYVDKYPVKNGIRESFDTAELLEEAIWDGNLLDTDAAGYFAWVPQWNLELSDSHAERVAIIMQVQFDTMDAVDSAFALTEINE